MKDAFFSLKTNKSPGYDKLSFNIIKKWFGELYDPLKFRFELLLAKGTFPDDLKSARVTPVLKGGDRSKLENYKPISVLPYFSKILEFIIYNHYIYYMWSYKHLQIPLRKQNS